MSSAWIVYDPTLNKPIAVSWKKSNENCFEISYDLALKFMEGSEKLSEYCIKEADNKKFLQENEIIPTNSMKFWIFKKLEDENNNVNIKIRQHDIIITLDEPHIPYVLYACLKDDPSWLINTWVISSSNTINGAINLQFPNAENYSYYLRK